MEGKVALPPSVQASLKHVEDLTADCIPPQEVLEMRQVSGGKPSSASLLRFNLLSILECCKLTFRFNDASGCPRGAGACDGDRGLEAGLGRGRQALWQVSSEGQVVS